MDMQPEKQLLLRVSENAQNEPYLCNGCLTEIADGSWCLLGEYEQHFYVLFEPYDCAECGGENWRPLMCFENETADLLYEVSQRIERDITQFQFILLPQLSQSVQ